MATPKEWQQNLERIQQISGTAPVKDRPEPQEEGDPIEGAPEEKPSPEMPLEVALKDVRNGSREYGQRLIKLLETTPAESHEDMIAAFLEGLIITTIVACAQANANGESN